MLFFNCFLLTLIVIKVWSCLFTEYTHLSIICNCLSSAGLWGAVVNPSWHWEQWCTPSIGHRFIKRLTHRDEEPFMLKFAPTGNLQSPIYLTCISLGCVSKLEHPEGTQADTGRTWKLHRERPGLNPEPSCCKGDSADHCTTVPPFHRILPPKWKILSKLYLTLTKCVTQVLSFGRL